MVNANDNAVISFEVPGIPIPKGRPRFGRGRAYTPARTVSYEGQVRGWAILAMNEQDVLMLEGPVKITVAAYFKTPKKPKSTEHITRPDLTNILKALEDSLNGVCYRDDSQIVQIIAHKFYSDRPRVTIEISCVGVPRRAA